jgi:murein DD-endopeptidase MepM/ murein hydrolase activator NlpD
MSYAWPVPGHPMSTAYGIKGNNWRACGWHTGIDIAAPAGTPIVAPEDGDIRSRSYGSSFGGKQFALSPDGPGEWFFAHVSWRLPDGTRVRKGQHIANVGSEGNATGPHLHLEYHPAKQNWSCGNMQNPMDRLSGSGGGTPPSGGGWQFPAGHKVYQKFLKVDGHEQNQDRVSDSIKALQEMLNKHSMPGGQNMPITGKYWTASDREVRLCQSLHLPPADPEMKSYVGAKQWEHLKAATGCPYEFVPGDNAIAPTPPPTTPPPAEDRPGEPAALLPGAIWDPIPKSADGWFTGLRPFTGTAKKITVHTTETAVKPNWAQQGSGIPHFTLDLVQGKAWQHLPLDVAAYTLLGGDTGQSPNSDSGSNIQLEIIGYSADVRDWPDDQYARLAGVLAWLHGATGVPLEFPVEFKAANQARRLNWPDWAGLSGVLGHQHAPFNDHSDPGALDVSRLVVDVPEVPPPPGESGGVSREEFDAWRKKVAEAVLADWG